MKKETKDKLVFYMQFSALVIIAALPLSTVFAPYLWLKLIGVAWEIYLAGVVVWTAGPIPLAGVESHTKPVQVPVSIQVGLVHPDHFMLCPNEGCDLHQEPMPLNMTRCRNCNSEMVEVNRH